MAENHAPDVRYCSNCKKDIASANFVMHEMHCKRHIVLCKKCNEPIPKSEEEEHFEAHHAKIECDLCKMKVEKSQLEQHKDDECQSRPQSCSYCELQMPKCDLPKHLSYCGTRTEPCAACDQFIMIKDLKRHLDSNCQYPPPKPPPPAAPRSTNPADFRGRFFDPFSLENIHQILDEANVPQYPQIGRNNFAAVNDQQAAYRSTVRNNTTDKRRKNTTNSKTEVNRHNDMSPDGPLNTEYDSMLSQLISASRDPDEDLSQYMETIRKQSNGLDYGTLETDLNINSYSDDFQVPCEFCGETFPSYSIIQHQSGCELSTIDDWSSQPASAERNNEVQSEIHRSTAYVPVINNLHERHLWRSTEQLVPENDDSDDDNGDNDVELPCEFCTELFPSSMLVIHQSICEANTTSTPRVMTPVRTIKPKVYKNTYNPTVQVPHDNFNTRGSNRRQVSPPPGFHRTETSRNYNDYNPSDKFTSRQHEDNFDVNTANNGYSRLTSTGNLRSQGSSKRRSSKPKETLDRLLKDDVDITTRDSKRNFGSDYLNTGVSGGAGYFGEERKQKVPISAKKVYDEVERESRPSKRSGGTRNIDTVNTDSVGASSSRYRATYLLNGDTRSEASQSKARSNKAKTPSKKINRK